MSDLQRTEREKAEALEQVNKLRLLLATNHTKNTANNNEQQQPTPMAANTNGARYLSKSVAELTATQNIETVDCAIIHSDIAAFRKLATPTVRTEYIIKIKPFAQYFLLSTFGKT